MVGAMPDDDTAPPRPEPETRFVEHDPAVVTPLVEQVLLDVGGPRDPATWTWVRTGSSSIVVLAGEVAVRVARDGAAAADLVRSRALLEALPALPFSVARPLGALRTLDGVVAAAAQRVAGEPRSPGPAEPAQLRAVLDAIHGLDPGPLRPHLAAPRAFCGGADWYAVLTERAIPRLPAGVRGVARAAVDDLAALVSPRIVVNHGDLAGANMLWRSERVVGVLDWDLTAEDDPAEDLASLLGWHGWQMGPEIADGETLARAALFRRCFPIMVVGFAVLRARPDVEVDRVTARAAARLRQDQAGTGNLHSSP
jgi:aminoglycoside phosphotransferase (APT) family kinase protein